MGKVSNTKKIEFILYGGKETDFRKERNATAPVYKNIYEFYTFFKNRCFYISPSWSYQDAKTKKWSNGARRKIDWMGQVAELDASIKSLLTEIKSDSKHYKGEEKKKFLKFFKSLKTFFKIIKEENKQLNNSLKNKQKELCDEFYRII